MAQHHMRGALRMTIIVVIAAIAVLAVSVWTLWCPCERTPGGYLFGEEVSQPVADWSFVNSEVRLCQIQVQRGILPHSINLNCMSSEGALYLSCAGCEGKAWSSAVLVNPEARIRINDNVYPVHVTRVTRETTLDRAWQARAAKLGRPTDSPRQEGWWSFLVVSR
jgi:hypothetical protein